MYHRKNFQCCLSLNFRFNMEQQFSLSNCCSSGGYLTLNALLTRGCFSGLLTTRGFFVGCSTNSSSMELLTSSRAGFHSRCRSWMHLINSTSDPMVCTSICWRRGSMEITNCFRRIESSTTFFFSSSDVGMLMTSVSAAVKSTTSSYPQRSGLRLRSILLVFLLRELSSLFINFRIHHFSCSVFSGISKTCSLNFPCQLLKLILRDQELINPMILHNPKL